MQYEFLFCQVETFLSYYMFISLYIENIIYAHDVLVGSDQWKAFSCTNLFSSMKCEKKVFKPVEVIVNILLGLQVTSSINC